jgi:gas vesicle protein
MNLNAYIKERKNTIKGHIRFCVQMKLRDEEINKRKMQDTKENTFDSNMHYNRGSVTTTTAQAISNVGNELGDDQATLNERNVEEYERLERAFKVVHNQKQQAEQQKRNIETKIIDVGRNDKVNPVLKQNILLQAQNSQVKNNEECAEKTKEAQETNDRLKEYVNTFENN